MKKKSLLISGLLVSTTIFTGCVAKTGCPNYNCIDGQTKQVKTSQCPTPVLPKNTPVLRQNSTIKISVVGQGVSPCKGACSPAQAYAMAKRAAIADAYRLIAEKVSGVYVEGDDYIKNMMVKRSTIRTFVSARIRNANVVETTFKDGLCEVEMEIRLSYADLYR